MTRDCSMILSIVRPSVLAGVLLSVGLASCQTNPTAALNVNDTVTLGAGGVDPTYDDLQMGKVQFAEGNFGLAEKYFRQTVERKADNPAGWMGLAASYDRLGRYDLADRAYDALLKIKGREPRILNNMGYSQYLRGDKKKARLLYDEALRLTPNDPLIHANIALL